MTFFRRHGVQLPIEPDPRHFQPGNIVAWDLGGGVLHIGVVSSSVSASGAPLVIHNIGAGPKEQDVLFRWRILANFVYPP